MFTCNATGYPAPVITWWKDSTRVLPTMDGRYHIFVPGELNISSVIKEDAGNYSCEVSQLGYKTEMSARAVFTVLCMYIS